MVVITFIKKKHLRMHAKKISFHDCQNDSLSKLSNSNLTSLKCLPFKTKWFEIRTSFCRTSSKIKTWHVMLCSYRLQQSNTTYYHDVYPLPAKCFVRWRHRQHQRLLTIRRVTSLTDNILSEVKNLRAWFLKEVFTKVVVYVKYIYIF